MFNIITNIYNYNNINIKKNDDINLKSKSIHKLKKKNLQKNNTYNDNIDDNNCDWGWFVEIDEY